MGCLWDRTLIWLIETYKESSGTYGKLYTEIVNPSSWGNYGSSTVQATGYSESWKANNIYDLAGNVWEWTIEAYSITSRIIRGGSFSFSGSVYPVSSRGDNYPSVSSYDERVTSSTLY